MSHRTCNIVDICKIPGYELLDINFPKIYNHFFILYKLKKKKKPAILLLNTGHIFIVVVLPLYCFCPTESLPDS